MVTDISTTHAWNAFAASDDDDDNKSYGCTKNVIDDDTY